MLKNLSQLFALLCLLAVQGTSQLKTWMPHTLLEFDYQAYTCPTLDTGITCITGAPRSPVAGVWVTLFISPTDGSGWHTAAYHNDGVHSRPPADFVTVARVQTGADGWAYWHVISNDFAGEYNVYRVPEIKEGFKPFPTVVSQFNVAVRYNNKYGGPETFYKFKPGIYASGAPTDIRHRDAAGNAIYNMWGENGCLNNLELATRDYAKKSGRYRMAPWRISIPDGGKADNEIDANTNYLFGPWLGRIAAWNQYGTEVDIVNPKLYANVNDELDQHLAFSQVQTIMFRRGWVLSETDQLGQSKLDIIAYWYGQPMNHYVCKSAPLLNP